MSRKDETCKSNFEALESRNQKKTQGPGQRKKLRTGHEKYKRTTSIQLREEMCIILSELSQSKAYDEIRRQKHE